MPVSLFPQRAVNEAVLSFHPEVVRGVPVRGTPAEEAFARLARVVAAALRVPIVALSVLDHDRLCVIGSVGITRGAIAGVQRCAPQSPLLRAIRTGEPVLIPHGTPPGPGAGAMATALGAVAQAVHPIRGVIGGAIGSVWIADTGPRRWDPKDLSLLADVSEAAGAEIARLHEAQRIQEQVHLQAAFLEQLFQRAPEGVVILDNDDRVLRANPEFSRMFGFSLDELVGRPINSLIVPPDAEGEAVQLSGRALRGETFGVEVVRRRRDGTRIHTSLLATPVRTEEGQHAVYAIYRDITERRWVEQALQRNEQRFRSLIENAADTVLILGAGGAVEYASPSVERMLGFAPEQLAGSNAFALVHPDDAPYVIQRFSEAVRGEEPSRGGVELRARHRAGGWRVLEVRARNLLDDPAVGGVVVNVRDVTEERRAESIHHRLNAFLEATPDFVAIFDPHGRALSVNAAFRRLAALASDDDLSSVTLADLYPPAATELIRQEGMPTAVREGVWFGETVLQRGDGRQIPVSQVILAHKSASGAVEYLSTLARDISEQKEAEARLRQSEQHFRSLIENARDIITVLDAQGRVRFESPSVERVLGYTPDQLIGVEMLSLVHPEDREQAAALFHARGTGEAAAALELRLRHRDGSWRVLESVSQDLLDDPAVSGVVVNSRDVTERRAAEEALRASQQQLLQSQKMEAVGRLAGGVAHDFNNLLTAIKGFTELLILDFDDRDPRRPFVTEIQSAANRAAALTRQLLAFSRKQVLQPKVLELGAVVSDMEKMLRRLIGEDVELVTAVADAPGHVRADPGQIEQVVLNLVVNARDAMPGGGRLRISTRALTLPEGAEGPPAGPYVELAVTDTGHGMDRDTMARIFEPFFTTKEQGKGTGLGLSTVYGIVQQSGGHVTVDSEPGRGTTFRVLLPRVDGAGEERAQAVQRPAAGGKEAVLLVEDEQAVRVLVQRVLARNGYRVIAAENGPAALTLLERHPDPIDLLLTDVVMPGMSGRELAGHVADRFPGVRVVYMSGYTDDAIVHHGVLDPDVFFVEKPFTPDILLRKLREVLDSPASPANA